MNDLGGPAAQFPLAQRARTAWADQQLPLPDFTDTQLTFSHLDDRRLRGTRRLFQLMGYPWLTRIMGSLGIKTRQLGFTRGGVVGEEYAV